MTRRKTRGCPAAAPRPAERRPGAPECRLERGEPSREAIRASLDGYIADGARFRRRLKGKVSGGTAPLSQVLQEELYDEQGLPKR